MQSPMKRRLLVCRGATDPLVQPRATDPLVDVCSNLRSIINRTTNDALPFPGDFPASEAMNIVEGVRRGSRARGEVLARRRRRRIVRNQ
jgi:hypothetical protein